MTHVWQYYNGTLSKAHAFGAHAQAWIRTKLSLGAADFDAKLYEYDFNDDTWNDMGFEGQAQMMEDWFKKGMLEAGHRYDFINRIVHGNDTVARGQTRSQIVGQSLGPAGEDPGLHPSTAVAHVGRLPLTDALLVELLQQRFAANDVTGYGARARKVERLFGSTNKEEAAMLAARVSVRKQGDKVSMYFHDRLSTPERSKLVHTLQSRAAVK